MLALLVIIIVAGLVLWAINHWIPMQPTVKKILNIVVIVFVVLLVLNAFGVFGLLTHLDQPVPRVDQPQRGR
jgi:hypothetical protein